MTARTVASAKESMMIKLLAIALVIVTVLPIVIFATDITNSGALRATRQATLQRAGVAAQEENPDTRRERVRARRAQIHQTVATVVMSMTLQLVILTAMALVGRRLFALRL
jgi:hypothetical protein